MNYEVVRKELYYFFPSYPTKFSKVLLKFRWMGRGKQLKGASKYQLRIRPEIAEHACDIDRKRYYANSNTKLYFSKINKTIPTARRSY